MFTGRLGQHALSEEMSDVTIMAPGKRGSGEASCCIVGQGPLPRVMHSSAPAPMLPMLRPRLVTFRSCSDSEAPVGR